jgi:hypothetical protein
MALQIVLQPQSVLVDQSTSTATFTTSAIEPLSGFLTVNYQWRIKDVNGTSYSNLPGATNNVLSLAPVASYDMDSVIAVASVTASGTTQTVSSVPATYAIRLSGDIYSPWEVNTFESGQNRVRRLSQLGYL